MLSEVRYNNINASGRREKMGKYDIRDEKGRKVGTLEPEEEVNPVYIIGCIGALGVLAILSFPVNLWIQTLMLLGQGEIAPLFIFIPMIVMTIIQSNKIETEGLKPNWKGFFRLVFASGLTSFACYMVYYFCAGAKSIFGSETGDVGFESLIALTICVMCATVPAAIAMLVLHRRVKKPNSGKQ